MKLEEMTCVCSSWCAGIAWGMGLVSGVDLQPNKGDRVALGRAVIEEVSRLHEESELRLVWDLTLTLCRT